MSSRKYYFIWYLLLSPALFFAQKTARPATDKIEKPHYRVNYHKSDFDVYDTQGQGFVLFYKTAQTTEFQDCIRLSADDVSKYKNMDLPYYASLMAELIKKEGSIIKQGEAMGKTPYHFFVYEKMLGKIKIRVYSRFYLKNGTAYNLSLRAATESYEARFLSARPIFDSFVLR